MTIEELKALEAAATKGPFRCGQTFSHPFGISAVSVECGPVGDEAVVVCFVAGDDAQTLADAAHITATLNHNAALLAAIDAMREEIKSAREFRHRLQEYSISCLNANGERSEDMMRRLIAGYSTLKANTDTALAALETKEPKR